MARAHGFFNAKFVVMKKIVGYPGAYSTYYLGHIISVIMLKFDWGWLYKPYNNLMTTSVKITDWAAIKTLWNKPTDELEEEI